MKVHSYIFKAESYTLHIPYALADAMSLGHQMYLRFSQLYPLSQVLEYGNELEALLLLHIFFSVKQSTYSNVLGFLYCLLNFHGFVNSFMSIKWRGSWHPLFTCADLGAV